MVFEQTRGWIGVDIGTDAVKLAQIERRGSRIALLEAAVVQRTAPWREGDNLMTLPIQSDEEILTARSLGERFSGRNAAATLPMAVCELHSLQVSGITRTEQRAQVAEGLALALRENIDQREFDFWSTDYAPEKNRIVRENVTVMSIVRDWANRLTADHRAAKLACRTLDGTPLALARAVHLTDKQTDRGPVAALDWGFSRTTLCIVAGGRPIFVRNLRGCGFGQLLQQLQDALSLSHNEAQSVAITHGAAESESNADTEALRCIVNEIVAPQLDHLIEELGRTLTYLKMHRAALLPHRLWLFGGGATMKDVGPLLTRRVGLPVAVWSLGDEVFHSESAGSSPAPLLGPAIALSALAWERP